MINRVYLDIDGILADFVQGVADLLEQDVPSPWPAGEYNIEQVFQHKVWGILTEEFWANLPLTDEAQDVLGLVNRIDGVHMNLCTSPPPRGAEAFIRGRASWIVDKFGQDSLASTIMVGDKSLLAKPNALLIDDSSSQISAFARAGGQVATFPQPWNLYGEIADEGPIAWLRDQIQLLINEDKLTLKGI